MGRAFEIDGAVLGWLLALATLLGSPVAAAQSNDLDEAIRLVLAGQKANNSKITDGRGKVTIDVDYGKVFVPIRKRVTVIPPGAPTELPKQEPRFLEGADMVRVTSEMGFYFSGRTMARCDVLRWGELDTDAAGKIVVRSYSWSEGEPKEIRAFDGQRCCWAGYYSDGRYYPGVLIHPPIFFEQTSTEEMFKPWEIAESGLPLHQFLKKDKVLAFRRCDDGRWYFRVLGLDKPDWHVEMELWIDPQYGYGIADSKAHVNSYLFSEFKRRFKVWDKGIWFPEQVEGTVWDRGVYFKDTEAKLREKITYTITQVEWNVGVPKETFTLDGLGIPEGTRVSDTRHSPPREYEYLRPRGIQPGSMQDEAAKGKQKAKPRQRK
ncbi:MAG: hypothetical protein FJ279_18605 [Planctomycetes bacterium]|nr:hypothetical protein [Planctomycetota bacterium]MBM4079270.1 hypothetical protein [Planctomycetota bacterium]